MKAHLCILALVLAAAPLRAQDGSLHVLRHTPADTASPGNVVTVIFDRPVAGRLGADVDAARIFRIEPAVAGHVSWRDPITIRFVPDEPLTPGDSFTVTVDTGFEALDGSRLELPYRFAFRVPGPRLIERSFRGEYSSAPQVLPLDGRIRLVYSAPVDLELLRRSARLELTSCEAGPRTIALLPIRQRPVADDDPIEVKTAGGWDRDTLADRFRRVVELEPADSLPVGCWGHLVLPNTADDALYGREESYAVSTAPLFRLAQFSCDLVDRCLTQGLTLRFSAQVDVDSVKRYVHLQPYLTVPTDGWSSRSAFWTFTGALRPRTKYVVTIDPALRDVDGRAIAGPLRREIVTGDYEPAIGYERGTVIVPRSARPSISLRHVNVRSVKVTSYLIPDSMRARALWLLPEQIDTELPKLGERARSDTVELPGRFNVDTTTDLPIPSSARDAPSDLVALRVDIVEAVPSPERAREDSIEVPGRLPRVWTVGSRAMTVGGVVRPQPHYALLQVTDLAVHAKVGAEQSTVLVTGLTAGRPREGALVRQLDSVGKVIAEARTGRDGIARLVFNERSGDARSSARSPIRADWPPRFGIIEAELPEDRVSTPLTPAYLGFRRGNPLDPGWLGANVGRVPPAAATIFADRGIYRPGEMLYLEGVIRVGELGALAVPPRQLVRITVTYRPNSWSTGEDAVVHDTVLTSSEFGTVVDSLRLRTGLTLGEYGAELYVGGEGAWRRVANESFKVAEYRAPEFLVDAHTDSTPKFGGDTVVVDAAAHYLFGAPMGNASVHWSAVLHEVSPSENGIPGADGWTVGEWDWTGRDEDAAAERPDLWGEDTLATDGHVTLRLPIADLNVSRPGEMKIDVAVTDVNRQTISTSLSVPVHPARLYVLARKKGGGWFWDAGKEATTEVRTVRPDGAVISDVPVTITVVRKEWRSIRDRYAQWADTTLLVDTVRTLADPVSFSYVPPMGGLYELRFSADDGHGGNARTTLSVWALARGGGWWARTPYDLPLMVGKREVAVGDTVPVAFDSPFDSAEAWITLEREQVIEQRHQLVHRGMNEIAIGITGEHIPNVFVSVLLLARGAPARPDSAQRLVRVGYQELAVKAAPKRLAVSLAPEAAEYHPGDSAVVRVRVRGADGRGVRSELTLWAVDQGVLALTGFTTPDLLERIYQPRALGTGLWSTLPSILTAHPEMLAELASGFASLGSALNEVIVTQTGAGVMRVPSSLRSEFRSTAFFLASARTDDSGGAVLRAKLPDNLTTYGVMAVAVGTDDRFGSGDTTLVATRPLVARPSLPRFVRASDSLFAGAVVNARDGLTRSARLTVESHGIRAVGDTLRDIELAAGKGAEARFAFAMPARDHAPDSVKLLFRASSGAIGDAVESRLAVKPDFHVRAHTAMGAVSDHADVTVELPADIDADRSRVTLRVGVSPVAPMLAAYEWLRVYPYYCTEQISSGGRALIAVWRATRDHDRNALGGDPRPRLQQLADEIAHRQRSDGAIRYWDNADWSSPWLSAYAGIFLLDARDEGIVVDDGVLRRLSGYLSGALRQPVPVGGMNRFERRRNRLALGGRVAVVDYLRRAGSPDVEAEDALLRLAPEMTWEDRLRLAEVLASRDDARAAARALVAEAWKAVTPAGRMVDLPDSAFGAREFPSRVAPAARLLTATLALQPDHPWIGGLVERVLQEGRAERGWAWSTQDYASVVMALAALEEGEVTSRKVRVSARGRTLLDQGVGVTDSTRALPLTGLLESGRDGRLQLRVRLSTSRGSKPVYYALTVNEVPSKPPVTPDVQGVSVERWYERFDNGEPVTSVKEGDLVRVRLRITVPADREYLAVEDPLPAGLEVVDLSLRTSATLKPFVTPESREAQLAGDRDRDGPSWQSWLYGSWDDGWWSPWEHKAVHDDKVVYFARKLWKGSYTASYVARATTAGTFVRPPAHAEEMYNPAVQGRSDGGRFGVDLEGRLTP
ncbi:MAG TPA: alpha-2-macroglobulin family protein [Gemmatimonadaceae bacterium]